MSVAAPPKVLNPELFACIENAIRLGRLTSRGNRVNVVRRGRATSFAWVGNPYADSSREDPGRLRPKRVSSGETYEVNCPFCSDTRGRLSIDHMWNTTDEKTGRRLYFLANCFNEGCLSNYENVLKLEQILDPLHQATVRTSGLRRVKVERGVERVAAIGPPGPCVRLNELAPTHPACVYLSSRGHDPVAMGTNLGISYCTASRMVMARDRIIFPAYEDDGRLAGWQARYVGEKADGDVTDLYYCYSCGYRKVPRVMDEAAGRLVRPRFCPVCRKDIVRVNKYFTCPDFHCGEYLMGYDAAKSWPFGVLVEGPLDWCRVGSPEGSDRPGPACCLFGKKLSDPQRARVVRAWYGGTVVILLDPDAYNAEVGGTLKTAAELSGAVRHVLPIRLPDGTDPGKTPHEVLWKTIRDQARSAGIPLPGVL